MTPSLALYKPQRWPAEHRTITVRFVDGAALLRDRVRTLVQTVWNRTSGLQFAFVDSGPADVRVSFAGAANWCYPGNYALGVPEPEPTMLLGSVTATVPALGTILHEFGHACGYLHEQQSPNAAIPWDVEAVYEYYRRCGWDRATVDAQVLWRIGEDVAEAGTYDPASIMHYRIPPELVLDGVARGGASVLSDGDRQMAQHWYGPPPTLPPAPVVETHSYFFPIVRRGNA